MDAGVDLYWLPLGAGGWFVRLNGIAYEAMVAAIERRPRRALYHSALIVTVADGAYVIESAPIRLADGPDRGVTAEGPVGSRLLRHLRLFRYEVRCWCGGILPDVAEAVASPVRLSTDVAVARRLIELVPALPTPVWGRDELAAGEMWNSNSVISWLLASSGLDVDEIAPPAGGRAPGWAAGLVMARRGAP